MMNDTIKNQLNHRTIRNFKEKKIDVHTMNLLFDVARRAPSAQGMQSFSMIHVKSGEKKKQIAQVCGQEYVETTSALVIFLVDIYRNKVIAKENDSNYVPQSGLDMGTFIHGVSDCLISAQNMVVAAESLGIGTVYFGSILKDVDKIIEILKLPLYTFPIIGVGLGYAEQEPKIKPRLPKDVQIFEDEYAVFDNYTQRIHLLEEEMNNYIDLRDTSKSVGKFSAQVVSMLRRSFKQNRKLLSVIKKQGFLIE